MAKTTAKNAEVLINGYKLSTYSTAYAIESTTGEVEATGFMDGTRNYIPGLTGSKITADMLWSASDVHGVLGGLTTGQISIIPETYVLGCSGITMPFMQSNYTPGGSPSDMIKLGSIGFMSYGADAPVRYGWALAHNTITATTTGSTYTDPTDAARTSACGAVLHIWDATATDTYVVKIQHSANGSAWSDLITFSADGSTLTAEKQTVASGTVNKYWRTVATRTGAAADNFGFSVVFFFE